MWLHHAGTGRRAPIEVTPPADGSGNIRVLGADRRRRWVGPVYVIVPRAELAGMAEAERAELRLSHFARCPAAEEFRR